MTLESLIDHYGYAALFAGTLLEGETVLVLAGFAAHRGLLWLPWVLTVAFLGSLAGDQLWFFVGRLKGRSFIASRPQLARRAERVQTILLRHELLVVLGFRFVLGIKTVTPLLLGASGYRPLRFTMLNIAGAAIWSIAIGCAGYAFGHGIELLVGDVRRYEGWLFVLMASGGFLYWLARRWRIARRSKDQAAK